MNLLIGTLLLYNLLTIIKCSSVICFPGENTPPCGGSPPDTTNNENTSTAPTAKRIMLRSRLRRGCFGGQSGSSMFHGECRFKNRGCKNAQSSFSRTCGSSLVCCKVTNNSVGPSRNLKPVINTSRKSSNVSLDALLNQPDCGIALVQNILGGQNAKDGEFPFMVSFVQTTDGILENFCGGVLISPIYILTAAHCFDKYPLAIWKNSPSIDIRIGITNLKNKELRGAEARIRDIISHPDFERQAQGFINPINDIAIVELDRRITNDKVGTACLPTSVTRHRPDENSILVGWGSNSTNSRSSVDRLQKAFVPVISTEQCQDQYTDWLGDNYRVNVGHKMLCAGNTVTDSCPGDSGAPILWRDDQSRLAVAGIVSFGPSGCGTGIPGVFTKVENYLQWISTVIQ